MDLYRAGRRILPGVSHEITMRLEENSPHPDPETCEAAEFLRARLGAVPQTAVVLGTGLGRVLTAVEREVELGYSEIPGFSMPTATGHSGRLISGRLGAAPLLLLAGRTHLYEGAPATCVTRAVRVLHHLGVRTLIVTNAAGGLNPELQVGEIVLLEDQLDFTFTPGCSTAGAALPSAPRGATHTRLYDPELIERSSQGARRANLSVQRGVYAAVTGPNYETRAEWRCYRRLGADVIGMSTAHETATAAVLGMRVLGISIVTNRCLPDAPATTDGAAVARAAESAADRVALLLREIIRPDG